MRVKIFLVVLGILLITSVIAEVSPNQEESDYVEKLLEEKGKVVEGVSKLESKDLPKEVSAESVEENNVGIFKVNYQEGGISKSLFVISYIAETVTGISLVPEVPFFRYLTFREINLNKNSGFITESGYVSMDEGSLVGMSSGVVYSGEGVIRIYLYKNGEETGLYNEFSTSSGERFDFDFQSIGLDKLSVGDVLSLYVESKGGVVLNEISTTIKIQ